MRDALIARLNSRLGRSILGLVLVCLALLVSCAIWLERVINPPRTAEGPTPATLLIDYDEVRFRSVDGVPLAGWFIAGERGAPTLILCHDLGEDRSWLLNIAVPLQNAGYNIFLFDFRGHGHSEGRCALGAREKRDILGALDYLAGRKDLEGSRVGLFGVRMGAQAAVLAALDRPQIRAIVLDSPSPDVRSYLAERISENETIQKYLSPIPLFIFDLRFGTTARDSSAAAAVRQLHDRDLLFIASEDGPYADEVKALYASVPEGRETDKNLLLLPGSGTGSLYAEAKQVYDETLLNFFEEYLPLPAQHEGKRRSRQPRVLPTDHTVTPGSPAATAARSPRPAPKTPPEPVTPEGAG